MLAGSLRQWASDWQIETMPPSASLDTEITCEVMDWSTSDTLLTAQPWRPLSNIPGASVWWALQTTPAAEVVSGGRRPRAASDAAVHIVVLRSLYGARAPTLTVAAGARLADEMAAQAWADWLEALGALAAGTASARGPATSRKAIDPTADWHRAIVPWSGALLATLPWCGEVMHLLFSGEAVRAFLGSDDAAAASQVEPSATRPVPLLRALGEKRLTLTIELAALEIELGVITALESGDVLCTTHELGAPLRVRRAMAGPSEGVLCDAYLGRDGAHRAVELSSPASGVAS